MTLPSSRGQSYVAESPNPRRSLHLFSNPPLTLSSCHARALNPDGSIRCIQDAFLQKVLIYSYTRGFIRSPTGPGARDVAETFIRYLLRSSAVVCSTGMRYKIARRKCCAFTDYRLDCGRCALIFNIRCQYCLFSNRGRSTRLIAPFSIAGCLRPRNSSTFAQTFSTASAMSSTSLRLPRNRWCGSQTDSS
jgi:hypothetical protein